MNPFRAMLERGLEVGAGSDVASIKTTARKVGGDWVINGGKMWTTNGTQSDWMCLLASTDDGPAHKNKSLIVVPMKTKGIEIAKKLDKLGMRASDTVQTFFDEVKVPVRYTIGQPSMGFTYQMQQFQEERLWAGAGSLNTCERLINATIEYTRERKVFGKPLLDNQVIHFRLAELKSEVEALRSIVYRACEDYLAGKDVTMLASMAKLKVGRLGRDLGAAQLRLVHALRGHVRDVERPDPVAAGRVRGGRHLDGKGRAVTTDAHGLNPGQRRV